MGRKRVHADIAHLPREEYDKLADRRKPAQSPEALRLKRYGLTPEQHAKMVEEQVGACAICHDAEPSCVDHDHGTGKVRGLLCSRCNQALGLMDDRPEVLERAAAYLRKS